MKLECLSTNTTEVHYSTVQYVFVVLSCECSV